MNLEENFKNCVKDAHKKFFDNSDYLSFFVDLQKSSSVNLDSDIFLREKQNNIKAQHFKATILYQLFEAALIDSGDFSATVPEPKRKEFEHARNALLKALTMKNFFKDELGEKHNPLDGNTLASKVDSTASDDLTHSSRTSSFLKDKNIMIGAESLNMFQTAMMSKMKDYDDLLLVKVGRTTLSDYKQPRNNVENNLQSILVNDQQSLLPDLFSSPDYCDELLTCKHLLQKKLQLQMEKMQLKMETPSYYALTCNALNVKARALKSQICVETYTGDALQALRKIKKKLDADMGTVKIQIASTNQSVQYYQALDQEYNDIVNDYTTAKQSLKEVEWALEKLKSIDSTNAR